jgi:S1-C subfamily serine protease
MSEIQPAPPLADGHHRSWVRSVPLVAVALVLVGLGIANITARVRFHHVDDGVLWGARAAGVTAVEVAPGSTGEVVGIEPGDVLLAVNGAPVTATLARA